MNASRVDPHAPAAPTRRKFDSLEQEAYLHLWRTYDRLKLLEERLFEAHELSAQQYNALRLLRGVAPESLSVQKLGSKLISRAPDMTRMLDRLEQRGFIVRSRRADNRRVVDVALAPAGQALLDDLAEAVIAVHREQLGHLSADDLKQLIRLLSLARQPHETADSPWTIPPLGPG